MNGSTVSLQDLTDTEFLQQAQMPIQAILESLDLGDASSSFRTYPNLDSPYDHSDLGEAKVRKDENGLVIIISKEISKNHFDPYKMAVFASDDVQAFRLKEEMKTWLDFASNEHGILREDLVKNSHLFAEWLQSINDVHCSNFIYLESIARVAGLVAQYCHPYSGAELRAESLTDLANLAKNGVDEADSVIELLTTPSPNRISEGALDKNENFVDSPITGIRMKLVETSDETEVEQRTEYITRKFTTHSLFNRPLINRLVREAKLRDGGVRIIIAGCLDESHSIFSLYTLLRDQVDKTEIPNIRVDIGVINTTYHIQDNKNYVMKLKRWFNKSQNSIPSLCHLIKSAANNNIDQFQIKPQTKNLIPSAEELVLFYLKMLAPEWRDTLLGMLEPRTVRLRRTREDFWDLIYALSKMIPKEWTKAIEAHSEFCEFIQLERPEYQKTVSTLSPINLLTDNQLTQAGIIFAISRDDKRKLERRFPAGASRKILLLSETSLQGTIHRNINIKSPYKPSTIFSSPKWNEHVEKDIKNALADYLIPSLKQDISVEKIKAAGLIRQKRAAREAVETVKEFVTNMQMQAINGDEDFLINGLTFLLAIMEDVEPYSRKWQQVIAHCGSDREALNRAVFGSSTRTLPDTFVIKFLTHYVGPKKYAEREFPGIYQEYNDELLKSLARRLGRTTYTPTQAARD